MSGTLVLGDPRFRGTLVLGGPSMSVPNMPTYTLCLQVAVDEAGSGLPREPGPPGFKGAKVGMGGPGPPIWWCLALIGLVFPTGGAWQ